ncbi:TROVE domain-containing protein [Amycolatopsis balhimycina DSM 5908]|uniref:TROVE domain-containing protein n=1 Tax=Amycolatopsis balhimycina DSM 5908 TaxID=1081091 RepID=A0A428WGP0_AMYBA|nr:TROVE domain-containing protein [Amycolatopsis balhimycina]RSM42227.1 TROVE domain-containing protein [Amycolatopsis balhimycina DSM 5908]
MSKFNTARAPAATSPVRGEATPSTVTHQGGAGYARDARSELFLLAVTTMAGEHTYYETADTRDTRYAGLVRKSTLEDPQWTARFLRWLRTDANLRTAALVGAAEFAKARRDAGLDGLSRQVVASVLQRADEPGELLAYWTSVHGRAVPKPVKRGIADAVEKLYDERSFVKWDSASRAFRFADVLELTHPGHRDAGQAGLFRHILDERHDRGNAIPAGLETLRARAELLSWDAGRRRELFARPGAADVLRAAGMTWESVAGWLQGPLDARVWEALIPSMGYMALLRNLRNFDEAGVSDEVAQRVAGRLADPAQIAKSRQLPMRFLSAYRAAPSLRWAWALEQAVSHALANVPVPAGRTLVLVDTSASMNMGFSKDGTLMRWDAAAVFGLALGRRCADADIVSFSDSFLGGARTKVFKLRPGGSLLSDVERWKSGGFFLGGGTNTAGALKKHFAKHDRVVILTDEQAGWGDVGQALPAHVPLYTWNLAGYRYGHAPSGSAHRHTFGGLTDQAFRMIPLLERGIHADWPF